MSNYCAETLANSSKWSRRNYLLLATTVVTLLALASFVGYTPADAQTAAVKPKCKPVLTAPCPKNTKRVCTKTEQGCCVASKCEAN
jgi:hypothetical protein